MLLPHSARLPYVFVPAILETSTQKPCRCPEQRARAQIGVGQTLMATPRFWLQILLVYIVAFSLRVVERAARWLFFPNDNMVLAEIERVVRPQCDILS